MLFSEPSQMVLVSRQSDKYWLSYSLFSWCQPPKTNVSGYVSDQVRYDPSSIFQAHSNGPTFEAIGAVADMLFTIQCLKRVASRKVFCVLQANGAPD